MISSIILNGTNVDSDQLTEILREHCPQIKMDGVAPISSAKGYVEQKKPELIFYNLGDCIDPIIELFETPGHLGSEMVILSNKKEHAYPIIRFGISNFVLKPINPQDLVYTINHIENRISGRKRQKSQTDYSVLQNHKLVGIPTMEGYEIIATEDIIRCEGFQKCTRIITKNKSDIISSYHIGVFKKLLQEFQLFFFPHRSHIINMKYVIKYKKIGSIQMSDKYEVPVSRSNRDSFLQLICHI